VYIDSDGIVEQPPQRHTKSSYADLCSPTQGKGTMSIALRRAPKRRKREKAEEKGERKEIDSLSLNGFL
jgi:hypothetical protein